MRTKLEHLHSLIITLIISTEKYLYKYRSVLLHRSVEQNEVHKATQYFFFFFEKDGKIVFSRSSARKIDYMQKEKKRI